MASAPPEERLEARPLRPTGPIRQRAASAAPGDKGTPARLDAPATPHERALSRTGPLRIRREIAQSAAPRPSPDVLVLEPKTLATSTLHSARPSAGELVAHPFKSLYMLVALLVDRRVSFVRKLAFAVPIALLVLGLLIPETLFGLVSGLVAPVIGLALDVPLDAVADWLGIALLAVALLCVFPKQVVAQYHAQLFHPPTRNP